MGHLPPNPNLRCLVIGNGPSLREQLGTALMRNYFTFGSNKIFMSGFEPTIYCAINDLVILQSACEIASMKCPKFITDRQSNKIPGSIPLRSLPAGVFSTNPNTGICEGGTVTYVLLQLAFWFGFHEVGLIGVDHDYQFTGLPNEETICKEDNNHFCKDYFTGCHWNNPDLHASEQSYRLAKDTFEQHGRKIVNLTPGSKLEVFDKEDWKSWL